jgi:hypothetical protein
METKDTLTIKQRAHFPQHKATLYKFLFSVSFFSYKNSPRNPSHLLPMLAPLAWFHRVLGSIEYFVHSAD